MPLRILSFSLATAIMLTACSPSFPEKRQLVAHEGLLDLREWNFDHDGPVNLSGQWHFYWDQVLEPGTCSEEKCVPASGLHSLPGQWTIHPLTGEALPSMGTASYRLTVLINEQYARRILSLKIPEIRSASSIYVNDIPVNMSGNAVCDIKGEQLGFAPTIKYFYPAASRLSIILAVSNYHFPKGGLTEPLVLGTESQLTCDMKRSIAMDLFLFGSLIIIFLYHITLYLLRRREKSFLYFGLYCLLVAIFGIVSGNMSVLIIAPFLTAEIVLFLFHASFYFTIPVFAHFLYWNFPGVIPRTLIRITDPVPLLFLIVEALLPYWARSYSLNAFQIFVATVIAVTSMYLLRALLRGHEGMRLFLLGFIILVLAFANDALYYNRLINTGYYISRALLLFILFQSFLLAYRFAGTYLAVEKLSGELAVLNEDLAEKVKERTEELNSALSEMESINESLITTNRALEEAGQIADRDMRMAVNVQKAIIFKDAPRNNEWDVACSYRPMAGVSGDFYDFYEIGGKLAGVGLFDVSGHGVSSGLVTMIAKTLLFRLFRDYHEKDFTSIFNRFNRDLHMDIGQSFYYLTGLLLKLEGNSVCCLNAAHNDLLIRDSRGVTSSGEKDPEGRSGFLLGIKPDDFPYAPQDFIVERGDTLALFTGGLVEAHDAGEEEFGIARVRQALADAPERSSRETLDYILSRFHAFTGGMAMKDDFTLIIMRRL